MRNRQQRQSEMLFTYPKTTRSEALRCFERGLGYKATAKVIRVPVFTVRDWLRQWKKNQFVMEQVRRGRTTKEQQAIFALRVRGTPWKEVAEHFGCSVTTARNHYQAVLMAIVSGRPAVSDASVDTVV